PPAGANQVSQIVLEPLHPGIVRIGTAEPGVAGPGVQLKVVDSAPVPGIVVAGRIKITDTALKVVREVVPHALGAVVKLAVSRYVVIAETRQHRNPDGIGEVILLVQ